MRLLLLAVMLLVAACARPTAPAATPTPVSIAPTIREGFGGVTIEGRGSGTSDPVVPQPGGMPIGIDLVTLTHDGQSTFVVAAVQGGQTEHLTSAIGAYKGQRPLVVQGAVAFQVTADGAWAISVQRLASGGPAAFSGAGDAVSAYFDPPPPGRWDVSHDGRSTFFVYAHCLGGSIVVANANGALRNSPNIEFPRGACFWEVRADGAWRLAPQ